MNPGRLALASLAILLLGGAGPPASGRGPVLRRVADVALPGPAVRFDYQSLDTATDRLYIAHMNAGEVLVFDLAHRRVAGAIRGLPRVTGVCAVPALGKVYASVPGQRRVAVINARTLEVEARLGDIGFPDGIAWAPVAGKVYVSDEAGGGELVLDATTDRVITVIPLGGEAGNTLFDPGSGRVLVAVQTRDEVVEIDPRTDRVVARHRWAGLAHPHGLSSDQARRLLFVANEGDATLLTVSLATLTVVGADRVGADPDVLAFDPVHGRLYVAAESGTVTVFTERGGRLVREGALALPHAHTVAVDPRTQLVYLPLQDVRGRPVLRIMTARAR